MGVKVVGDGIDKLQHDSSVPYGRRTNKLACLDLPSMHSGRVHVIPSLSSTQNVRSLGRRPDGQLRRTAPQ